MEQQNLDDLKSENEDILVEYFLETRGGNYNNWEGGDEALDRFLESLTESEINQIVTKDTLKNLK
tara:strand:+ start:13868 stop:14062 length:195 start_codon:yes stop_codon:yes gene_type:complete